MLIHYLALFVVTALPQPSKEHMMPVILYANKGTYICVKVLRM